MKNELFASLSATKSAFGVFNMNTGAVPKAIIGGISEQFTILATTVFENTADVAARYLALGELYNTYLNTVGIVVTHPKSGY